MVMFYHPVRAVHIIYTLAALAWLFQTEVECGKGRSGGGSRVRVSSSSGRSRIGRHSSSFSRPYRFRSSLSRSRLPYMFPTRTALLGIFVAYPMRPSVHLHTYRDLERYTVCEGVRTVYDNGTLRNYSYFICPDSLSDRSLIYCCSNNSTDNAQFCCSSDNWRNIVGGILGTAMGLVGFGMLVYCCCRRRRTRVKQPHQSLHSVTNVGVARVDSSDSSNSSLHIRNQPTCPYPIPTSTDVPPPYPVDPKVSVAPSSIGAGWCDDTSTVAPPSAPVPRAETPPPPYPTDDTTASVQPSAPDPP
ncbi:uncharacterized protein DEA37_0000115 [Paragonimus westermani]|uniref:Uncharacterized protein n=1 Tax=Paragonimus westermani TaxID=34504 RepID=A0A5J4NKB3_9TREM|nr:uncharacterized protein DEA37_0000115 [Paragonimus westermani]